MTLAVDRARLKPNVVSHLRRVEQIAHCEKSQACTFVDCQLSGEPAEFPPDSPCRTNRLVPLYLNSKFCLMPKGDTPTRKGLFDALLCGCIPIVFDLASADFPSHLLPSLLPD